MSFMSILKLLLKLFGIYFNHKLDKTEKAKKLQDTLNAAQTSISIPVKIHDSVTDMRNEIKKEQEGENDEQQKSD